MKTRVMRAVLLPVLCWLLCGCGQKVDGSLFTSARLLADGNTVVYAAHRCIYRKASGLAAYPDGGMPSWLRDEVVIGRYDRTADRVLATRTLDNDEWVPGQGQASILDARGGWVLLRRGGQRRDNLQSQTRHLLLRGDDLDDAGLDLESHVQGAGVTLAEIYFADNRGTLAAVVTTAGGGTEVHVRLADGTWRAPLAGKYNGMQNGEIFVWQGGQQLLAYNLAAATRRTVPANAVVPPPDPAVGVNCANDRIEYGIRSDSGWQYAPLPLTLAGALR